MAGREEEDAAKALWELTNSPFGKARPPPIAAAAATAAAAAAAAAGAAGGPCLTPKQALGDVLGLGFHSPPPALHSPTVNYNKFFSPSQFSWSPLPGASPAPPHPAAHPSRGQSPAVASASAAAAAAAAGMPPALFNTIQPRAEDEAALKGSPLVEGSADEHTPGAAALGVSGGMRKKIYSKKLDFNAPPAENGEAGRVWLALDAETQRAARARALGQQAAAPGPFSKPGGGDAQLSLSQTSAASDFYFPGMGDPLAASQKLSQQSSGSGSGSSGVGSKRTSPLKDAAAGDLVMGGLLAGAGIAVPPELMDETSRPPDTSAATARAIFTPVVMNQHGGSNWGGIQVRVKKSAVKRSHDSAALAGLSNTLPMNEVSRSPIPAQQLKAASSSVKDAMAGMMSLAEGLFPKAGGSSNTPSRNTPSRSPKVDGGANAGPAGPPTCNCKKSRCLKLYCECFRSGRTCGGSCKCKDCANSEDAAFEAERRAAMEKIIGKKKCDIFALARAQLEQLEREQQQQEEKEGVAAKAADASEAEAVEARATAPLSQEEDKAPEDGEEEAAAAEPAVPTRRVTRSTAAAAAEEQPPSAAVEGAGAGGPPTPQVARTNMREAERTPRQQAPGSASKRVRRTPGAAGRPDDLFLLSVFGPRSKVNKKNSLEILSYLDRDDMADACLVSSLWWKLSLETLEA